MTEQNPEFEREVRFAVVIYGGVSLAVYINGVVQEMLSLVRATAPSASRSPSEEVYRKLACMLQPEGGLKFDQQDKALPPATSPTTKFVVDVLSGTSAGGINAIFLAKALTNNQSLQQLALMWIQVADIAKLLNDEASAEGPVTAQVPPKSLLNSRWMYLKLLEALDGMGADGKESLVEDLDLFSTTTDIDGVALPIALADKQVFEFRHRNVFHFKSRYLGPTGENAPADKKNSTGSNDFIRPNNPFLAYAARCTSAFPFAFEPMALCDVFDIISHLPYYQDQAYCAGTPDLDYWKHFYLDYIRDIDPNRTTPFRFRSFGDGGYLDNKPFSYAIDTIMKRHADLPVDRKLIYVEPSPENIGKSEKKRNGPDDRPDALENSLAALIDLPRYETIREDLERVLDWNRNVGRLRRVLNDSGVQWETVPIAEHKQAIAYQFYLRLRLSSVTDRMGSKVAEALQLDPNSARGDAIRALAGAWRVRKKIEPAEKLEFLATYDMAYLQRAMQFLRMHLLNERKRLQAQGQTQSTEWKNVERFSSDLKMAKRTFQSFLEAPFPDLISILAISREQSLTDLESVVNPQVAADNWKSPPVEALEVSDDAKKARLKYLMEHGWLQAIDKVNETLKRHFQQLDKVRGLLTPIMQFWSQEGWDRFDVHDSLMFPVFFGTNTEETNPIDVIRISPDDVADIEGVDQPNAPGPKLKGQLFGAFGGFFDVRWRLHDMLRGRLHAAERLITAILTAADKNTARAREDLIAEAQNAIARDWHENFDQYLSMEVPDGPQAE